MEVQVEFKPLPAIMKAEEAIEPRSSTISESISDNICHKFALSTERFEVAQRQEFQREFMT